MSKIKVLITVPEFEDNKAYLKPIAGVSSRLDIDVRISRNIDETAELLGEAEVLYTLWIPEHLKEGHRLKWVQMSSTGVDNKLHRAIFDPSQGITVTNAAGCHAASIGEYSLLAMGLLARGILQFHRDQQAKVRDRGHNTLATLWGKTVGIVGYGHIGREVARLSRAHHMRVLATNRRADLRQDPGYEIPGVGDPEGVIPEKVYGPEDLDLLLQESDFVVCTLPLTKTTARTFSDAQFQIMKKSAFFINVSRGGLVDHDALIRALQHEEIAGACLDVLTTDPKALPADDPLWEMENVLLTPHVSGTRNATYIQWINDLFVQNLKRYLNQEPLLNAVTREKGY